MRVESTKTKQCITQCYLELRFAQLTMMMMTRRDDIGDRLRILSVQSVLGV